jgi:GNAT superfamily N-acetyltransferase
MWFRQSQAEYDEHHGAGNRESLMALSDKGLEPGLIAYVDYEPAGWVSVAPRAQFGRLLRSPLFRPDDPQNRDVWSLVCLYIPTRSRGQGLSHFLVEAAVRHARAHGATRLDAYPIEPANRSAAELFVGTPDLYRQAGFREVARPNENRRVMSLDL